ncbi:MAG: hypothetical protein ABIN69_18170 [Aestuariivirga sp.]
MTLTALVLVYDEAGALRKRTGHLDTAKSGTAALLGIGRIMNG